MDQRHFYYSNTVLYFFHGSKRCTALPPIGNEMNYSYLNTKQTLEQKKT